jgi:hypothetical protein
MHHSGFKPWSYWNVFVSCSTFYCIVFYSILGLGLVLVPRMRHGSSSDDHDHDDDKGDKIYPRDLNLIIEGGTRMPGSQGVTCYPTQCVSMQVGGGREVFVRCACVCRFAILIGD